MRKLLAVSHLWVSLPVCLMAVVVCATGVQAQQPPDLPALLRELQSAESTERATEQILGLAKSDPSVRLYLAKHLQSIIERNPYDSFKSWKNAVRLAGELKLAEAAPALTKWIAVADNGDDKEGTPLRSALETNPAARALSQIGDPAVSALKQTLVSSKWQDRRIAIIVCRTIGSTNAEHALQDRLKVETDPDLRNLIQQALSH